jgi:DNA repair exonuclease SbcCD ATPase subunit
LSNKTDVFVIRGKYDLISKNHSNIDDNLFPILYNLKTKHKIHLLEKGGKYEYNNIVFGYTGLFEKVFQIDNEPKLNVGLYYGDVENIDDFNNYDYVLLGGNHQKKYLTKTIAYSGSLIQQNYDEPYGEHGLIKWDLKNKKRHFINIENNYGFITIQLQNQEKPLINNFPNNINLRIVYSDETQDLKNLIKEEIDEKYNINHYEEIKNEDEKILNLNEMTEVYNNDIVIERLVDYIKENYQNTDEEIKEVVNIIQETMSTINYNYNDNKKNIILKNIKFDNFNVFGEDNVIDYSTLKGVVNIYGKNGIGKSSVAIYVLLCAIYGKCDNLSIEEYLNTRKNHLTTSIKLDVNGKEYEINRKVILKNKSLKSDVSLYENGQNISQKTKKETNLLIQHIVGDQDELIRACILEQKKQTSFLDLSDTEKKNKICNLLKLDIYNTIQTELENKKRLNNCLINEKKKKIYTNPKDIKTDKLNVIGDEINLRQYNINEFKKQEKELKKEIDNINKIKIENELDLERMEKIDFDKNIDNENIQLKLESMNNKIQKLNKQKNKIERKLEELNINLNNYDNIEKKKRIFEKKKDRKINNLNDEISILQEQYINVEKNTIDIKETLLEKQEIENQLEYIKQTIKQQEEKIKIAEDKILQYENDEQIIKNLEIYNELIENKNKYDKKIKNNEMNIENYENVIKYIEYQESIKNNNDNIKIMKNNLEHYNNLYEIIKNHEVNPKCKICMKNQIIEYKQKIENAMEEYQNKIEEYNNKNQTIEKKINKIKNINLDNDDVQKIKIHLNLINENKIINEQIQQYDKYKDIKEKYEKSKKIVQENIFSQLNEKEINLKLQLKIIEKEVEIYNKRKETVKNNKIIKKEINNKKEELEEMKQIELEGYQEYIEMQDEKHSKQIVLSNIIIELNNLNSEYLIMNSEYEINKDLYIKKEQYNAMKKNQKNINEKYLKIIQQYEKINQKIGEENNIICSLKIELENIEKMKEEINDLNNNNNLLIQIIDIIKNGFVDELLRKKILPNLNHIINQILRIYVGFRLEMKIDKDKISVYRNDNGYMSNAIKLSGYESSMVNLGLRLTFGKISKLIQTNFFIIDEAFAFYDEQTEFKVEKLFEYMKNEYDFIIMISHNEQIKKFTDLDIPIIIKNGFSSIEKIEN